MSFGQIVHKVLEMQQKQLHMKIDQNILDSTKHNLDFMKTITTTDETWV